MSRFPACSALLAAWLVVLPGWEIPVRAEAPPRAAKVAGQFYPENPTELGRLIVGLLQQHPEPVAARKPRVLIVPHAGYEYSGPIAAAGYRLLQGQSYDGVVVVGFTHGMAFDGVSVDDREAYQTPLGLVQVDREAAEFLRSVPGIVFHDEAHDSGEHSLEVQLPFLQVVLPQTRIVPLLMGSARWQDTARLADALQALAKRGDYLFVFTTDLSHYHAYEQAVAMDERTLEAMLRELPEAVARLFGEGQLEACGRAPVAAGLLLADRLGYLKRELVSKANSGDTTGDRSRVVGYAALAMYERPDLEVEQLSAEAGAALVKAARLVLDMHLNPAAYQHRLVSLGLDGMPELSRRHGLFVTLTKHGQLRGCIGRIQTGEPLMSSLPHVAKDAALRDTRFAPVRAEELPELRIEVSVLTAPRPLQRLEDLVPGRDGVMLEHEGQGGVFLPQVWHETGWTREEFLRELASQKAGLPPDAWRVATLYVFQDQIFDEGGGSPH